MSSFNSPPVSPRGNRPTFKPITNLSHQKDREDDHTHDSVASELEDYQFQEKKIKHHSRVLHSTLERADGVYEGETYKGEAHGIGRKTYTNGKVYEGQFDNGNKYGYGTEIESTGEKYQGEWKSNVRHGMGACSWPSREFFEGFWERGDRVKGIYMFQSRTIKYEGAWKNDAPARRGKLILEDGIYNGHLSHKLVGRYVVKAYEIFRQGLGELHYSDSSRYYGSWKYNKREGYGVHITTDGTAYYGQWKADKKHGTGTLIYMDGTVYEGYFSGGTKHGKGALYLPNGDSIKGEFKDDNIQRATYKKGAYTGASKMAKDLLQYLVDNPSSKAQQVHQMTSVCKWSSLGGVNFGNRIGNIRITDEKHIPRLLRDASRPLHTIVVSFVNVFNWKYCTSRLRKHPDRFFLPSAVDDILSFIRYLSNLIIDMIEATVNEQLKLSKKRRAFATVMEAIFPHTYASLFALYKHYESKNEVELHNKRSQIRDVSMAEIGIKPRHILPVEFWGRRIRKKRTHARSRTIDNKNEPKKKTTSSRSSIRRNSTLSRTAPSPRGLVKPLNLRKTTNLDDETRSKSSRESKKVVDKFDPLSELDVIQNNVKDAITFSLPISKQKKVAQVDLLHDLKKSAMSKQTASNGATNKGAPTSTLDDTTTDQDELTVISTATDNLSTATDLTDVSETSEGAVELGELGEVSKGENEASGLKPPSNTPATTPPKSPEPVRSTFEDTPTSDMDLNGFGKETALDASKKSNNHIEKAEVKSREPICDARNASLEAQLASESAKKDMEARKNDAKNSSPASSTGSTASQSGGFVKTSKATKSRGGTNAMGVRSRRSHTTSKKRNMEPYLSVIESIENIQVHKTPLSKLRCIVKASNAILEAVDEYYSTRQKAGEKSVLMAAEDKLPVMIFAILRSRIDHLYCHMCFLRDFVNEETVPDPESVYRLEEFKTAIKYIMALDYKVRDEKSVLIPLYVLNERVEWAIKQIKENNKRGTYKLEWTVTMLRKLSIRRNSRFATYKLPSDQVEMVKATKMALTQSLLNEIGLKIAIVDKVYKVDFKIRYPAYVYGSLAATFSRLLSSRSRLL